MTKETTEILRGKTGSTRQVRIYGNQNLACISTRKTTNLQIVRQLQKMRILSGKRLCLNCTGVKHRADDCRGKRTCQTCKNKHHSSICSQSNPIMVVTGESVIYPVVVDKVNNILCRVLLDTGAVSSYGSSALLGKLNLRPI